MLLKKKKTDVTKKLCDKMTVFKRHPVPSEYQMQVCYRSVRFSTVPLWALEDPLSETPQQGEIGVKLERDPLWNSMDIIMILWILSTQGNNERALSRHNILQDGMPQPLTHLVW